MKLKKIGKSFFSLFLAVSMLMPTSSIGLLKNNVYAVRDSSSSIRDLGRRIGSFCSGLFGKILQDALGNVVAHWLEATGILDVDTAFILGRYGEDLTKLAKKGKIHDCIERDREIENLLNVLNSDCDKANAIITGPAGVGKTALVEGLAYRIATGNVPDEFKNKKVIRVNMVELIAGNTYTGSDRAPARIRAMLGAAERDPDIILFIDEFHQVAKIRAAELFKTYLERNRVKMIAATTTAEYEYVSSDPALERRFKEIVVNEPSKYQVMKVLDRLRPEIEKKYNIKISNEALSTTVDYTYKYMKDKPFPDKALSVLYNVSKVVSTNSDSKNNSVVPTVTRDDIISLISREVRVPLGDITPKEQEFLDSMEQRVKSVVVGQDKAVKKLCHAIKNSRSAIKSDDRPNISLFFTGTSGVGKSKLAQAVGNEIDSFIEVDFANYPESDAVNKLFDSKIFGYNGCLAEKIRRKPYSVVLFDNLEKAHPNTINSILSIIKKGYILDSKGNEIDFRNAFIVLNSKIGENEMLECKSCQPTEEVLEKINEKIKNHFGEDFFDSLDNVVVFNKLDKESVKKILDVSLDSFENILDYKNVKVKISDEVRDYICNMPINHKLGIASFDKVLLKYITKPLNKMVVNKKLKEGDIISYVLGDNGKIELKVE